MPKDKKKPIEQYAHADKTRLNNPPAGLVTSERDADLGKRSYAYDPHLEPELQWAGKAEHTSFEVDRVSLHVHERIDPKTIIEGVQQAPAPQQSIFEERRPLREAIDFYKHKEGWANRLIAGDSLLVMNSLLEKEGMGGKVQMIYLDPPYGIKYGSNFQPFVGKRDVKDGAASDLSREPETIKAFRDTWELGIHSYLTYLRDRLLLSREMLTQSGSIFVQISDENVHLVRNLMDEVFGVDNFVSMIAYKVTSGVARKLGPRRIEDYLIWYAKQKDKCKFRRTYKEKSLESVDLSLYKYAEQDGVVRPLTKEEREKPQTIPTNARAFRTLPIHSKGAGRNEPRELDGVTYTPPPDTHWRHTSELFQSLVKEGRIMKEGSTICSKLYLDDFPYEERNTVWTDTGPELSKSYVVQTSPKAIQRCILMTTDPGDLVFDPTCGSGTTAFVAEQWGRRWMTCDTSRVALVLAKQRLMTAIFDYYKLAQPARGVGSGFEYETVPHITLKSIANNEPPATETLYDKPHKDSKRARITGPFTVEAVPAPYVKSTDELKTPSKAEICKQTSWRDELLRTGIRTKGGERMRFRSLEPSKCKHIQVEAETEENQPKRVMIVFGPEHAPLAQHTVEDAWQEARLIKPEILLFCAFQFDGEAAKDIDELTPERAGMQLLRASMNTDLQTDDLKKGSRSNESFFLVGRPDVKLHKLGDAIQVEVLGFDYYDLKTNKLESGHAEQIAMWMLDTDYDGRSVFPSQVFFPMAGAKEGWSRLAKNLRAQLDEEKIEAFRGTKSLPFEPNKRVAIKIIDDRGIESLRIMEMKQEKVKKVIR